MIMTSLIVSLIILLVSCLTFIQSLNPVVLDVDGEELKINGSSAKYYILPTNQGTINGLLPDLKPPHDCPFNIKLGVEDEHPNGRPVYFHAADDKETTVVRLSSDTNIVFSPFLNICQFPFGWTVSDIVDPDTHRLYLLSAVNEGNPGIDTVKNWFKIEKQGDGNTYKIMFCPSVCSTCRIYCGDVGVFNENGTSWLGLNDDPLLVKFTKAI